MLSHLWWCPTAGWLHRSQFSLRPTPPSTLLRFRPVHSGAQWWDTGGQTLAVGGKCKGEDILQTHNCTSLSQSHLSLLSSSSDDD